MSIAKPPCPSPAEPGWRRGMTTREVEARFEALRLANLPNNVTLEPSTVVARAEAYRAFLMGETK